MVSRRGFFIGLAAAIAAKPFVVEAKTLNFHPEVVEETIYSSLSMMEMTLPCHSGCEFAWNVEPGGCEHGFGPIEPDQVILTHHGSYALTPGHPDPIRRRD